MFYDKDSLYLIPEFLNKGNQDVLENIVTDDEFPWFFNASTNGPKPEENPHVIWNRNTFDYYQFVHKLILKNEPISEWAEDIFKIIRPSLKAFFENDDYYIFRSKLNLTTTSPRTRKIFAPHADCSDKMWSLVYFINEVPNSHLLIGKQFAEAVEVKKHSIIFEEESKHRKKFDITKKVETKRGTGVLFDSRKFHSAGKCPEGMVRYVLNVMVGRPEDIDDI